VGWYSFGGIYYGFLLDVDGSYTTLDVPGPTNTHVYGINNAGQIVGDYQGPGAGTYFGFLLDVDGSYAPIGVPNSRATYANGINDAGQIAGHTGLLISESMAFC
jgi:hypothetical protein